MTEKLIVNTYHDPDINATCMNWVGKYSFGSTFGRGTRLFLQKQCGEYLGITPHCLDEYINAANDGTSVTINDSIFRQDDYVFCIHSLDEFINNTYDDMSEPLYSEITFAELEGIVNDREKYKEIFREISDCGYTTYKQLVLDFKRNDVIKTVNKAASKILVQDHLICVIYDFVGLINELKEINSIAKEHNVRFFWV